MGILRWEFFVVGAMWGLASILFKLSGQGSQARGAKQAVAWAMVLGGVALLILRFGLHYPR